MRSDKWRLIETLFVIGIMVVGLVASAAAQEKNETKKSATARTPQDVKKQEKDPAKAAGTQQTPGGGRIQAAKPQGSQRPDAISEANYYLISGPPGARHWSRLC